MAPETTAEKLSPAKVITGDSEFFNACLSSTSFFDTPFAFAVLTKSAPKTSNILALQRRE